MITLNMQNATLGYGDKDVVLGVTFDMRPGEMVGLVGPNGSGKSTIIKALSRILTARSGEVLVNGQDIRKISRRELALMIGVVPQTPVLPSAYTAFEIVLMGRSPHMKLLQYEGPNDMEIAWQAMDKTSTRHLAERRVGELSGGEIQSIIIARALAQETEAVLLDEPTANLDVGRQIEVLNLIKGLCRQGRKITAVAALHDLNLAAHYCDKLVLIKHGVIHAMGTPKEVITAENIQDVYGPGSYVHPHPLTGLPAVLPRVNDIFRGDE